MTDELSGWARGAAADLGFNDDDPARRPRTFAEIAEDAAAATAEDDDDEATEDAAADDGDESDDDEDGAEPSLEELEEAFWESLSAADRAAAERSETVRDGLWAAYLAEQGYETEGDADDGAEGDDVDDVDDSPTSGLEVVRMAFDRDASELADEDGEPVEPAAWLAWAVDADPRAWARACQLAGWSPSTPQPSHADLRALGRGVVGGVLAESWENLKADRLAKGRYLGQ